MVFGCYGGEGGVIPRKYNMWSGGEGRNSNDVGVGSVMHGA